MHYFDNLGGAGRLRTEFSSVPIFWSTPSAKGKLPDYLPVPFAEADYLINFAVLKGHAAVSASAAKTFTARCCAVPTAPRAAPECGHITTWPLVCPAPFGVRASVGIARWRS